MIKILVKNIKFSAINKIANMLYSLIFFPFIIGYVGKEVYGVYLLILMVSGYLSLLDGGLSSAVIKYVAEFNGSNEKERVNEVINFSLTFYILISLVITISLVILSFSFDKFFKVADINRVIAQRLFWTAGLLAVVYWPNFLFKSVLIGLQRYEWSSAGDIFFVLGSGATAFFLFPRGGNMVDFQLVTIFLVFCILIFYFFKTKSLLKDLKITFPYFNRHIYKLTFRYAIFLFLAGIATTIIFQIGNFIIGVCISVSAVTLYGIAFSMQQNIRSINAVIGSPFIPASAELHGKNDIAAQRDFFLRGTKFSTAIFVPIVIISIVFARQFIINWMGPSFADSILPAQLLLAFWIFSGTIEIGSGILSGKGIVRIFLWISSVCAILTAAISLSLAKSLNITGIALGVALPMIFVNFPLVLYIVLRTLKVKFVEFYRVSLRGNLAFYLLVFSISFTLQAQWDLKNIYLTIIEMFIIYLVCEGLYYRVFLRSSERAMVRSLLI